MNLSKNEYNSMVKKTNPPTKTYKTIPCAFLIGGFICLIGEWFKEILEYFSFEPETASAWTSIFLIFLSALLTGLGIYEKIAKYAGAGTLVPVTGFANGISACAIESKTEGFILGVGCQIFKIAGPVILYGSASYVIYGIIYYIIKNAA